MSSQKEDYEMGCSLASVHVDILNPTRCPFKSSFSLSLIQDATIWINGESGAGKTTIGTRIVSAANSNTGIENVPELGFAVKVIRGTQFKNGKFHILSQEAPLIDSLTVEENMKLALRLNNVPKSRFNSEMSKYLELAGLGNGKKVFSKYPSMLSLGLRRRVGLAVILSQSPTVLFLDEPFASLDAATAESIALNLKKLQKETHLSIIIVSHLEQYTKLLCPNTVVDVHPNSDFSHLGILDKRATLSMFATLLRIRGGLSFIRRVWSDFVQLVLFSLPMCYISGALVGSGFMAMLNKMLKYVNTPTLMKMVPQSVMSSPIFAMVKGSVENVSEKFINEKKPHIVGVALAYVSVEVAPLLVGMLMAGILGSAIGGRVATLQATGQDRLLANLGYFRKTYKWTLPPALTALVIGSPILSMCCAMGLFMFGIAALDESTSGSHKIIWNSVSEGFWDHNLNGGYRTTEHGLMTYPPFIILYRTIGFLLSICLASEFVTRRLISSTSARDVSLAIALSVMASYSAVLVMEYLYSKILIATLQVDAAIFKQGPVVVP